MRIHVTVLLGDVKAAQEADLGFPAGATVREAFRTAMELWSPGWPRAFYDPVTGEFYGLVMVNNKHVTPDAVLEDGDHLTLLPSMAGG